MERPTKERLKRLCAGQPTELILDSSDFEELFADMDALTVERDAALAASEINFATAKRREREALRRGFDAAQRWNYDESRPEFPTWGHFEKHLAEEKAQVAQLLRIAAAEEGEQP